MFDMKQASNLLLISKLNLVSHNQRPKSLQSQLLFKFRSEKQKFLNQFLKFSIFYVSWEDKKKMFKDKIFLECLKNLNSFDEEHRALKCHERDGNL